MFRRVIPVLVLFALAVSLASTAARATEMMEAYSAEIAFDDVRDNVRMAIAERGLVISSVSHVGEMLARTGKDLGAAVKLYDEAEIYEFCSAVLSRKMMEADRRNIAFCPFSVSIYSTPEEPGKVFVAWSRPGVWC